MAAFCGTREHQVKMRGVPLFGEPTQALVTNLRTIYEHLIEIYGALLAEELA